MQINQLKKLYLTIFHQLSMSDHNDVLHHTLKKKRKYETHAHTVLRGRT